MNSNKNDFFDSKNTIRNIEDREYNNLNDYLAPIKGFARTTYHSVYVIDYFTQGFEYVSSNPLFLCGLSSEQVLEMGYAFYLDKVIPEDYKLLLNINRIGFEFYEKIRPEDRLDYYISYDFHICESIDSTPILINHKLTPIFLNSEGKIWKALCIVSLSNNEIAGNITISKSNENLFYRYSLESMAWIKQEKILLDDREKEIITLSTRGLSVEQIAEKIYLSKDTVKYHRKKLFEKLGVKNISEAISEVVEKKII